MDFSSDTSAPAHPDVLMAMTAANHGQASSYGADETTAALRRTLIDIFETDALQVWPCASGTAANALALSLLSSSSGSILCHQEAHIECDERGAPTFFTGGAKLQLLGGDCGQIDEHALRHAIGEISTDFVHATPAEALSLTQLTECGTAYSTARLSHYCALAKAAGLGVHLDGARFANALVSQSVTPAEMSWKAGVDILSLGLTKTGGLGCELVILFGERAAAFDTLKVNAKRSGHMPAKLRYVAAQGVAMLGNNLWLDLASRANQSARTLSGHLCRNDQVQLAYPVDGNEVFVEMPAALSSALQARGVTFYAWPGGLTRFVCSWATTQAELDAFAAVFAEVSGTGR